MAKKKRVDEMPELDLVPIMNLVTILIPFLLMAASYVSLAVIDSTLPAIGAPPSEPPDEDEKPLNLSVIVTSCGYTVAGADAVLGGPAGGEDEGAAPGLTCTVPCKKEGCPSPDTYDTGELKRLLNLVKDQYEEEENVILVPAAKIPYEVLVITMDATRDDPDNMVDGKPRLLFPYVVIAGGVE